MERKLANLQSGIPKEELGQMATDWAEDLQDYENVDQRIIEIEAAEAIRQYHRWHVPELGDMKKERPDGAFRLMGSQLNSCSTAEVRDRKIHQIERVVDEYDVQTAVCSEVGVNWSAYPSSSNFSSWFNERRDVKATTAHNTTPGENIGNRQQGGCAMLIMKEMRQYMGKKPCNDFRGLGRWCSWVMCAVPNHKCRVVVARHIGSPKPQGEGTIYQQNLRYIQENGLNTNPRRMFMVDFLSVLHVWRAQGERVIVFIDMNEHILDGPLARRIMGGTLNFKEASHDYWGEQEPHTYIDGSKPIDGVYYSPDLEILAFKLLSFHQGVGDHRVPIVDLCTRAAVGKYDFKQVLPAPRRLNNRNRESVKGYVPKLEAQLTTHKLPQRLRECKTNMHSYPANPEYAEKMEIIDKQTIEIQRAAERKCRKIRKPHLPFSGPVKYWNLRRRAYHALARRSIGKCRNPANAIRLAKQAKIPSPKALTYLQCQDGVKYCNQRMRQMKKESKGRRRIHLRDCLIQAEAAGDKERIRGVKQVIQREEGKHVARVINRVTDDPKLGAIALVHRETNHGIEEVTDKDEMEREIQVVTEKRFDLAHSAKISLSSLREKLGYLSDTEFAKELLGGTMEIPADVDDATTLVLEEICRLGMEIHNQSGQQFTILPEQFRYFWRQVKESTSSSPSGVHYGHYIAATNSEIATNFLSEKLTVIARSGCPPERWGVGLQVMLEKIAGVALVNKLRAILLMEGDFNYFNKWAFGQEAIDKLYELGYVPEDQYSQKASTAEDAKMDNRLTMDLSRQMRHPMASTSADAANCYDRINHIIMSFLLLAILGTIGPIVAMLYPIQIMKFFQRTARGDSTTFMGGPGRPHPLQGLCQGNGAAPACWLMLSSVLMHCYERKGKGAQFLSPMSGWIIKCLGTIFVDDTDLFISLPELRSAEAVWREMQDSLYLWGELLCATGGALKPEKCYWYLIDYECKDGVWEYAEMVQAEMMIPMPDGSLESIKQLDVDVSKEMLGVWSCPSGDDTTHLEKKVVGRAMKWLHRTTNGHLPAKYAWVSYRFKLWPGIRYGLATLATTLDETQAALQAFYYQVLPILRIRRTAKKGWRTLPRAFGGFGLFSLPIEQMICWLNMLIQHFGVPTTLGKKFQASLEALQLQVGSIGNPLIESFGVLGHLAPSCWFKSLWERLWVYHFHLHLDYPALVLPREGDQLLLDIFLQAGYRGDTLSSLTRCRVNQQLLFLSDMASANGRFIEPNAMLPLQEGSTISKFTFPREEPTAADWELWTQFWASFTGGGLCLHNPLGKWTAPTHRRWRWFYNEQQDIIEESTRPGEVAYYHLIDNPGSTRGMQIYRKLRTNSNAIPSGNPATVSWLSTNEVAKVEVGPPLAQLPSQPDDFWTFLRSWGGTWMWEHIEGDDDELTWLVDALINNTAVLVTDGSFDRKRAPQISGAGWVICDNATEKMIKGSFFEVSKSASAYRGELLGLVALHTVVTALVKFYNLERATSKICCDNIGALNKSSHRPKRVRAGAKQSDLLRALRTLKMDNRLQMTYEWVASHQDRIKLWRYLTLEQQLNVVCDGLAKGAVTRSMYGPALPDRGLQLLPLEKAAVVLDGEKLTTDVAEEVRFCLGEAEARDFYTSPRGQAGGGLGWTHHRFDQVDWASLNSMIASKSDTFGTWLSKQVSGTCATRVSTGRMQDLLDDKCPSCRSYRETSLHLNKCPDEERTKLFNESAELLERWLHQDDKTDPELAYWIPKFLLFRGQKRFAGMGPMSPMLQRAAASQDVIGWEEFLHGRVSVEIAQIQMAHCAMSPCRMNGNDWMKQFTSQLVNISHAQWVYRNFTLHDKSKGLLHLQRRSDVLLEIDRLAQLDPDELPEESKFLLEIDFKALRHGGHDRQAYWVRAMKAARIAGKRVARRNSRRGASARRREARRRTTRPRLDTSAVAAQILVEMNAAPPVSRRRPHPSSTELENPCNKRWRRKDREETAGPN